ncbi:MAG TPA: hypothetical protein VE713_19010 [Pyrinomonadaceae bacterium]|jgi:hypothetical protein|nr:hypothetical protein [Pyrinomonadaceae bacterium]
MRVKIISLTVLLLLTLGCRIRNAQNFQTYTLPSGKQVIVESVGKIYLEGYSEVRIHYDTKIPIMNKKLLRKEVEEVWSVFQKDVDDAEIERGQVQVTHYWLGDLGHADKVYFFHYNKQDGKWEPPISYAVHFNIRNGEWELIEED